MKKYIYLSFVALFFASCSKNDDIKEVDSDALTHVCIGAKTGTASMSTRAIWGAIEQDNNGNTTVGVKFEPGESFDLFEYGYAGSQKFTDSDPTRYQSGNFDGYWHENATNWAAILPSGAGKVEMSAGQENEYKLTIPTEQTTFFTTETSGIGPTQVLTTSVSPDRKANVMVAAQAAHATTATCFLSPVCAYLYFYTDPTITTTVKLSCSCLAGTLFVKTKGEWSGWKDYVDCITGYVRTDAESGNEITAHGAVVERNNVQYCEYIVCVWPGNYDNLKITDIYGNTLAESSKRNTFSAVNLYYLGKIGN